MIDFKVGDRFRIKVFKDKDDYINQSCKLCWDYKTFLDKTKELKDVYTITKIARLVFFYTDVPIRWGLAQFQIEKVYPLKNRLQLIRELIK
jgi:hypothetical protein